MPLSAALLDYHLFAGITATNYAALGIVDKVQDFILLGAIRETQLDTLTGIGNIVTLKVLLRKFS